MKNRIVIMTFILCSCVLFSSCESEAERQKREAKEEKQRIELEIKKRQEEERIARQEEQARLAREKREQEERIAREKREEEARIAREARLEKERREKAIYDKYINNSLRTGSTPYAYCFGENKSCSNYGCSSIKVRTPSNSDVLVTIKKEDEVVRHAFIRAGSKFTFEFPNGTYQPFFYYGTGWNPRKVMKETHCGTLKGGFIEDEHFGKDSPQSLFNNALEYELILQQNGNFSTRPSNSNEAF